MTPRSAPVEPWDDSRVIDHIVLSVSDLDRSKAFYAQAASHFAILKDAWRNYTMHARGVYAVEQAEMLFESTKDFMKKLALKAQYDRVQPEAHSSGRFGNPQPGYPQGQSANVYSVALDWLGGPTDAVLAGTFDRYAVLK